jgi:hypothetical protein
MPRSYRSLLSDDPGNFDGPQNSDQQPEHSWHWLQNFKVWSVLGGSYKMCQILTASLSRVECGHSGVSAVLLCVLKSGAGGVFVLKMHEAAGDCIEIPWIECHLFRIRIGSSIL